MPSDFHYDELVNLLGYFGFEEIKKEKPLALESGLKMPMVSRSCCTNHIQVAF